MVVKGGELVVYGGEWWFMVMVHLSFLRVDGG